MNKNELLFGIAPEGKTVSLRIVDEAGRALAAMTVDTQGLREMIANAASFLREIEGGPDAVAKSLAPSTNG